MVCRLPSFINRFGYVRWTSYCADQSDYRTLRLNDAQSVIWLVDLIHLALSTRDARDSIYLSHYTSAPHVWSSFDIKQDICVSHGSRQSCQPLDRMTIGYLMAWMHANRPHILPIPYSPLHPDLLPTYCLLSITPYPVPAHDSQHAP